MQFTINKSVTATIHQANSTEAFLLCLGSLLSQSVLPFRIEVLLQQESVGLNNFYFNQLAALARIKGVELFVSVAQPLPFARLVGNVLRSGKLQWLVDDDCIYDPDCLANLLKAYHSVVQTSSKVGFIQGAKADVTNIRGYSDFSSGIKSSSEAAESFYFYRNDNSNYYPETCFMDSGNVLLPPFPTMLTSRLEAEIEKCETSGYGFDTVVGLLLFSNLYPGFLCREAQAIHLEKPKPNFSLMPLRRKLALNFCTDHKVSSDFANRILNLTKNWK
jgi:hypothetical protein